MDACKGSENISLAREFRSRGISSSRGLTLIHYYIYDKRDVAFAATSLHIAGEERVNFINPIQ